MSSYMVASTETSRAEKESEQHKVNNNTTLLFTKSCPFFGMICAVKGLGQAIVSVHTYFKGVYFDTQTGLTVIKRNRLVRRDFKFSGFSSRSTLEGGNHFPQISIIFRRIFRNAGKGILFE